MHRSHVDSNSGSTSATEIEKARLEALDRLDILDTPREEAFDRLVNLIRTVFDVPMAIVSVIDGHRQWYKAAEGLSATEVPRKDTFCQRVIEDPKPLIVPDTLKDPLFANNPSVQGEPFIRFYAGAPLIAEGCAVGTICALDTRPREFDTRRAGILVDLAYLVSHALTLRQTALTDPLTGLMSRRDFKEQGEKAVRAATRNGQPLSCLAFDIDHFKRINDRYGHAAGDSVLAGLVAVCQSAVPDCKLFGRLGGEEFAILLPQTDRLGAMAVAETLRSAIEGQPFYLGDERVVVTASFGTAGLDPSTRELDSLLSNADASLYRAKISGRNRTVSWQARDSELPLGRRRRVLKSGRIVFNNRMSTIDCTVRALGEQGASLDVTSTVDIPERFALCIPSDHLDANCRIVERGERRLEVEFR